MVETDALAKRVVERVVDVLRQHTPNREAVSRSICTAICKPPES